MASFPGLNPPQDPRLQLGQGMRGGRAAVRLSNQQPARGLPPVPSTPKIGQGPLAPKLKSGQIIPGSAGAGLQGAQRYSPPAPKPPPVPMTIHYGPQGGYVGPVRIGVGKDPGRAAELLKAQEGPVAMLRAGADDASHKPLIPIERKALAVLRDPTKYNPRDQITQQLIQSPPPRLWLRIGSDPSLQNNHTILQNHVTNIPGQPVNYVTAPNIVQAPKSAGRITPPLPVGGTPQTVDQILQHATTLLGKEASSNPYLPSQLSAYLQQHAQVIDAAGPEAQKTAADLLQKQRSAAQQQYDTNSANIGASGGYVVNLLGRLLQETGQTATGIGPGLYTMAGDVRHGRWGQLGAMGGQMLRSYEETVQHPLRQLHDDPLGFISNVATPFFIAARGFKTAQELGALGEAYKAGTLSKAEFAAKASKALAFPAPTERRIETPAGVLTPPAYRSALGGLLQTKIIDPLTEKSLSTAEATRLHTAVQGIEKTLRIKHLSGAIETFGVGARIGRAVRREQFRVEKSYESVALAKGYSADEARAIGELQSHLQLWHNAWEAAPHYSESYARNPDDWVAIKPPEEGVQSTKPYLTAQGVANKYKSMVERNAKTIEANPDGYRFMPRDVWNRINKAAPDPEAVGTPTKILEGVNSVSQLIRLGRFLHPGYLQWAAQNGILHVSQAGMFTIRNAWQLRNQYTRLGTAAKAQFDELAGTGLAGSMHQAGEGSRFAGATKWLSQKWHNIDDSYWRKMSLIHELNRYGYHNAEDWSNLMRNDPQRFRMIADRSGKQAIEYVNEMTPAEQQTLGKIFTAYGWTRGATSYSARFALEHPVQARVGEEVGKKGQQQVDALYAGFNGMVPDWLRGYLPLGAGMSPWLLNGSIVNPTETPANLIGEIGLIKGSTSSLMQEDAPAVQFLTELASGRDRYGTAIRGGLSGRFSQATSDLAKRFEPWAAYKSLTKGRTGGTFMGGTEQGLADFFGTGLAQLTSTKKTAALGMKDYEKALSTPDEINFRTTHALEQLPSEIATYKQRTGENPPAFIIGRLKGDLDMVAQRDLYQYHYAQQHGAKSWKSSSFPPASRLQGTIAFMQAHHYLSPETLREYQNMHYTSDAEINSVVQAMWAGTGIGSVANSWKNAQRAMAPRTVTPPNK